MTLLMNLNRTGSLSTLDFGHEAIEIRHDETATFPSHQNFRSQASEYKRNRLSSCADEFAQKTPLEDVRIARSVVESRRLRTITQIRRPRGNIVFATAFESYEGDD